MSPSGQITVNKINTVFTKGFFIVNKPDLHYLTISVFLQMLSYSAVQRNLWLYSSVSDRSFWWCQMDLQRLSTLRNTQRSLIRFYILNNLIKCRFLSYSQNLPMNGMYGRLICGHYGILINRHIVGHIQIFIFGIIHHIMSYFLSYKWSLRP